jgi:CDP-diacylglycerol--glycerol-3-phosphate 3-phosphatidyltransferase
MRYYPAQRSAAPVEERQGLATGHESATVKDVPLIAPGDLTTVPNLLSIARIVGVSAAVLLYFAGHPVATLVIGTVSCLTDHLDGYLARRLGQVTTLGAMLDQAADSYTTAIALAMLVIAGGFPFAFLLVFLGREFWVGTVRRYAAMRGLEIPSRAAGKIATAFIYWSLLVMAVAVMVELPPGLATASRVVSTGGMLIGLALSCSAAWSYTRALTGTSK